MNRVTVPLGDRAYDVLIGVQPPAAVVGLVHDLLGARDVFLVTDETVGAHYAGSVASGFRQWGRRLHVMELAQGEANKTVAAAERCWNALLENEYGRDCVIVALGGGIVGDLAGFVAATWMRGVDFVNVPTSLLAMVDASVGGKTGFNRGGYKNIVGAFHQPRLVFASIPTLQTLTVAQRQEGLAEAIKHGIIAGPTVLDRVFDGAQAAQRGDVAALLPIVLDSVAVKAEVVIKDERESGLRQTLNLGHTFGHAIEAQTAHRVTHGVAVALGLVMAARLSERMGYCDSRVVARICDVLEASGLPTDVSDYWNTDVVKWMSRDKKRRAQTVNFVVVKAIGNVEIVPVPLAKISRMVR